VKSATVHFQADAAATHYASVPERALSYSELVMMKKHWLLCFISLSVCLIFTFSLGTESAFAQSTDLMREMQADVRGDQFWAIFNYTLAISLFGIAVISSVLATVGSSTERLRNKFGGWIAVCAAIPALALMVDSVFRWEGKAEWHRKNAREVMVLIRKIRDQGESPKSVSIELDTLEEQMEKERPSFGRLVAPGETPSY
jgi:hypothetical protein